MSGNTVAPILPWKRPTWIVVLLGMLVFGFYQELAKVHLNHYIETLDRNPEIVDLEPSSRAMAWKQLSQPKRLH
jgi:hypothetical protein